MALLSFFTSGRRSPGRTFDPSTYRMSDLADRFTQLTGSPHYLDTSGGGAGAVHYLKEQSFLAAGEYVTEVASAGPGNMNVTLRITTDRRSFILKQSRPWVAKYPDLAAPIARILVEEAFSEAVSADPYLAAKMPRVLGRDATNFVLLLEDLGPASDLSSIYADGCLLTAEVLADLLKFAGLTHRRSPADFPPNTELRALNHAHVFDLPFRPDNGFPLDEFLPGLAGVARPFQHDEALRAAAAALGQQYLATGDCLIHGDFYPGSFLGVAGGVYVIDAEFAHLGRPEYDLGVLMAHLLLARCPEERLHQLDADYIKLPGFSPELARRFCYVEIIRRLIGIAQLPLSLSLEERRQLLDRARAGLT